MKTRIHCAAVAPSTGRWSTDRVTCITVATARALSTTTGSCRAAPTARMAACGGLMMPANSSVPNMPRLVTLIVPPSSSLCCSFLSFARAMRSCVAVTSWCSDSRSTPRTTGVTRPFSVATATAMSTWLKWRMASPVQITLRSGTSVCARPTAFTTRSLTDTFGPPPELISARSARRRSTFALPRR